jgi:AcrR family transcriptional regulator
MARGRAATYDVQHDAILLCAAELFASRGYPATSMNEVALACGLSKPALYHYFRHKDALLVEIALTHVQHLHALVDRIDALALEPDEHLRRLITGFVESYAGAQHAHRVLTEDTRFLPAPDRERVLTHERKVVAAFARAITAVRPDLAASRLDKPLTMLLFGMINWTFTWLKPGGALDHQALAPMVVDLFLGGLPAVAVPQPRTASKPTARGTTKPKHARARRVASAET